MTLKSSVIMSILEVVHYNVVHIYTHQG